MNGHQPGRHGIVVGIDPDRERHLPLAWAADEAHRRRLPLRLVLAVPPRHDALTSTTLPAGTTPPRRASPVGPVITGPTDRPGPRADR
ncbi:hypothetical protein ACIQK6_03285 [Streptomyces sp. NPDC091682]|uniref:hypothetical protein n=1 Tax=Streptomyces sp. NPDC091682 TaxID=3366005 RepID=UPI00380B5924